MAATYPCPCCGYTSFGESPGSYAICGICFWEDDHVQLRWPDWTGGANQPSLIEAQKTYERVGAMEATFLDLVRRPGPEDQTEPGWRPITPTIDVFEPLGVQEVPWPDDLTVLYWWRPTFWRRDERA